MEAVELLRKIQRLEQAHARLKHRISTNLRRRLPETKGGATTTLVEPEQEEEEEEDYYVNILQSMGQSVYLFDVNDRIVYWNQMSENLYGYTAAEALGKTAPDIIIEPKYSALATIIIHRAVNGETWSGQFPVRTKYGDRFSVITTLSPCRDQYGISFGAICVCADTRPFRRPSTPHPALHSHHPLQTAIVSKISTLASKVKSKLKTSVHDSEGIQNSHKVFLSFKAEAEAWMGKSWPWKLGNENRDTCDLIRPACVGWPVDQQQESGSGPETSFNASLKLYQTPDHTKEAPGLSWSDSCGTGSSSSSNSSSTNTTDIHTENLDVKISWDDLIIREQIGQGSRGTVYHAMLYGSDVAVKIFSKQEYSYDVILSFRKEVCLMKRLRHPNILLFMGAVISPQYLCIVTEFLPRGSLFRLLQRRTTKLDWRRRVHIAMDIARGMNYLHHCHPPIIHRNLKSSNLLVDKNWTLKVGDFGLSRVKHATYLATNAGTGMPHWMAPEVLRNEKVDEKSDVYSYGVVLWEITTGKIPWENLNSMQVIGAVGFMNQRLEIPNDVDPQWASLIKSCWSREPQSRPTFQEILIKLKYLQKKFTVQ